MKPENELPAHDRSGALVEPDSPFGDTHTSRRRRFIRLGIYAAVIVLAVTGTYFATRTRVSAKAESHNHAAGGGGSDSAAPVMLSADGAKRIGVTYATASIGSMAQELRAVGQIAFDETRLSTITTKVDGFVEELNVNATGQSVRRGEPLLSIYSPMLVSAQEELLLARRLVNDVGGGTAEARRSAEELLASSRRRLLYWDVPESELDRIERTGEVRRTTTLRSSASGFVVEKAVNRGQRIMAGDALLKLADLSVVWVDGQVFEQDLAAVQPGQRVKVTVGAFPSEEWLGRVAYVYPTLDGATRTTRVRVELANSGLRLKPGMYATLNIAGGRRNNVLSVPRSAILSSGKRDLVFVRQADGMLEPRAVAIGMRTADRVEIREGLASGETVVASATFLIDAESNLDKAVSGMANMPGMSDMPGMTMPPDARRDQRQPVTPQGPPLKSAPPTKAPPSGASSPASPGSDHARHRR